MQDTTTNTIAWEDHIVELLDELSSVQDELFEVLRLKQQAVAAGDLKSLDALAPREAELAERLETCHSQRGELLSQAEQQGLPGDSISTLAQALPLDDRGGMSQRIESTSDRMHALRHQGLSGWVLAQRALLHVSQMLQIIAGGGEIQPTYGKGANASCRGALVDEAA